jgi:hypothetical protein
LLLLALSPGGNAHRKRAAKYAQKLGFAIDPPEADSPNPVTPGFESDVFPEIDPDHPLRLRGVS